MIYTCLAQQTRGNRKNFLLLKMFVLNFRTLFNALLQSDLCKLRAMDLIERVTTSIWPGTTMNLLKFPLWNPSAFKLELRKKRLKNYYSKQKQVHSLNYI